VVCSQLVDAFLGAVEGLSDPRLHVFCPDPVEGDPIPALQKGVGLGAGRGTLVAGLLGLER
jgi:hypothetical protein